MNPSRETPRETTTRLSLRVPKQAGETTLRLLAQLNLLDRRSKTRQEGETLVLPLARKPTSNELTSLHRQTGQIVLGQDEFESKTRNVQSLEETLKGLLTPNLIASLPASFDIVGDIAVVEFPHELTHHERVVAAGILRVHKNVRAVFAKAGAVSGTDRVRRLRHLAGEDRTVTTHREYGCSFKVDLAKAYFSPRLSTEHQRVAGLVEPGECVVDMFAGVGPFSILIVKRLEDVEVHAVDSNKEAANLIEENIRLNKPKGKIWVWAGDAHGIVEKNLRGKASRVIMNHPSAGREFVGTACMALHADGGMLHYYTFADGMDYPDKAVRELEAVLTSCGWKTKEKARVRAVRGVAPMLWQVVVDASVVPAR